jgi:hypothetical protein
VREFVTVYQTALNPPKPTYEPTYELVLLCQYAECGKNVLEGWEGSGLCRECDERQPLTVREWREGRWRRERVVLDGDWIE